MAQFLPSNIPGLDALDGVNLGDFIAVHRDEIAFHS